MISQWQVYRLPWAARGTGKKIEHFVIVAQADSVTVDCAQVIVIPVTTESKAKPGVQATEVRIRKRTDHYLEHDSVAMAWQMDAVAKSDLDARRLQGRVSPETELGLRRAIAQLFGTPIGIPPAGRR